MSAELKPVFTNPEAVRKICDALGLDINALQHLNVDIDVTGRIMVEAKYYAIVYEEKEVFQ